MYVMTNKNYPSNQIGHNVVYMVDACLCGFLEIDYICEWNEAFKLWHGLPCFIYMWLKCYFWCYLFKCALKLLKKDSVMVLVFLDYIHLWM